MKQLSGMDNLFLAMENGHQRMHVGGLGIYDPSSAPGGKVRFKGVLDFFSGRLGKSKIFRRRLVNPPLGIDRPYWIEDPDIDLEYHIRHIALPKPGDWRQLCILVARIHARPLDLSMPAWECYVIEGLNNIHGIPPGSFAFFIKMHHAAIDGEAGAELMKAIHSFTSNDDAIQTNSTIIADREPSAVELYARAVGNGANLLVDTSKLLLDVGKLGLSFGRKYLAQLGEEHPAKAHDEPSALPAKAPVTRFDHAVSAHRVVEALGLPMGEIHQIRSKLPGVTVNDVFMAVTGGALRKYLADKHELPESSLNAMVPISTRGEKKDADVGNQVGMSAMPICTNIADPLERLQAVRRGSHKTKQVTNSIGKDLPGKLLNLLPAAAGKMLITQGLLPRANLTISNVRGPDVPLYLAGAKMVLFLPVSIPMDNLGLNITGFSYNGTLWVCAVACRQMMPDPAVFAQCYRDSFEELLLASKRLPEPDSANPAAPAKAARPAARKPARTAPGKAVAPAPAATPARPKTTGKPAAARVAKAVAQPAAAKVASKPRTTTAPAVKAATPAAVVKAPVGKSAGTAAAAPAVVPAPAAKVASQPRAAKTAAMTPAAKAPAKPAASSSTVATVAQPQAVSTPPRKPGLQPPSGRAPLKKVERKPAAKAKGKAKGRDKKGK
ncbi:WS/DGAT/MGAT family O-acyltransferase [Pseudomonas sp. N040]|uniref:WS/DGAT/MGAT family O-acyltransferase n=1 Tax=Pseudomonas sp. N040 TaxID=2785325 RepID=UPI0018A2CBEC|nr:wax ester/triacylglycerol synthase family O-acyltransferase [Pseudomonas sp. N040]MBF7728980.1 wax ester/triacylglycerol synthase family O-acyltransferase [Pseudomonas sp. N040]MBW7012620.1 wax ester/triacylglycerol synthase family O-acyltransferase [Pseudomonas sp. N040]